MAQPVLVVMAAGLGSRFGGLKQIEPVGPNGQIIIHYSLYDAYQAGFRRVIFIIKEELLDVFEASIGRAARNRMEVSYVFQKNDVLPQGCLPPEGREKPLGTGHAIYCLNGVVDQPFAVINADDFYGRDCFCKLYAYLKTVRDDAQFRYCMVGFPVENTLTAHGTVSRGICATDANGFLTDIVERTAIHRNDGRIVFDADGTVPGGVIAEGTPVSMNMWGFTPSFLPELDRLLSEFLRFDLPKNPLKGEFYLPFAVDRLLRAGKATVQVLDTTAKWHGITYPEDKPVLKNAIAQMTQQGVYPAHM